MKYVIDASTAFQWEVPEPDSRKAIQLPEDYANGIDDLISPDIFPAEVGNTLIVAERKGRGMKCMNAADVSRIIKSQVGTNASLPNSHGIDLRRCLTTPTLIKVIHRRVPSGKIEESNETVWLVLEERPAEKDGYKIVFNEQRGLFGLASQGFPNDPFPVLCGYYGDFPTTLAGM
jgi:hypothetical protein